MNGALPYPYYALKYIALPGVEIYQSRADFRAKVGVDPPPFNPMALPKSWAETRSGLPRLVNYQTVEVEIIEPGHVVRIQPQPRTFERGYAMSVNIPTGAASAPGEAEDPVPFPVRDLFDDEELAIGLGGDEPVVRNRTLWAQLVTAPAGDTRIITKLDQIIAALKAAGIG